MHLTSKVIFIIVVLITTTISGIFYLLALRFENQMLENQLATARAMYKNILTIRRWVSEYNGVYVDKQPGTASNPYLPNPDRATVNGDTLTLKNPALVTRELSELSQLMGGDFGFHMASRRFLNPNNRPDPFEEAALIFFEDTTKSHAQREFYRIETVNGKTYFRYFAPLYTEESCLTCHSKQGYRVGDLRGGISILLSMNRFEKAKKENLLFIIKSAFVSIVFLSIFIFVAIQRIVIHPLKKIEKAAEKIQKGDYNFNLRLRQKDEIGRLAVAFEEMREQINSYTSQLKDSEKKYRSLIEHTLEAVAIVKSNGRIIECNEKFQRLTGYDLETLKSMNFSQLVRLKDKKRIRTHFDRGVNADHFETMMSLQEGMEIPVEIYTIRGLSLGKEKDVSFIYVRDLSERKKIEQYSIQAEKMFALGQLSSGVAHEIRNPLFALSNNIDYLNRKFGDQTDFQEIYPELRDSVERIHRIVSSILDYTRPHEPEFKPICIKEVIEKSLTLVSKQFEKSFIRIHTEFKNDHRLIEADPHQLEQVFINLFLNAFQAMEGAGQLSIRTKSLKSGVQVDIEDTGRGIPARELGRIFDPFYSTFSNGTGLGLAIVQRILRQHRARYRIKSKIDKGTTFILWFPYKQE